MSVERMRTSSDFLDTFKVVYNSPANTALLKLTPTYNMMGNTMLLLSIKDNDPSFYNEKVVQVPVYIIPFINKAPTFDSITDKTYPVSAINQIQYLNLTGVNDGNGSVQKLALSAVSSNINIATVTTSGSGQIRITPKAEGTITITTTLKDDGDIYLYGKNSKTQTFKVVVGSGINGFKPEEEMFSVYPNPAENMITISNPGIIFKTIEISDITGHIYVNQKLTSEQRQVNVSNLPSKICIVKMINENTSKNTKIVLK